MQTIVLQVIIHTDGRRQDGRTIGLTNERSENIQTNNITNNITNYAYRRTDGHMDGRTHTQTILELVDRQLNRNIHKTVYLHTNGWTDRPSNRIV